MECKGRFRGQLAQIDVQVNEDEVDYWLCPVTNEDLVSMAAVVTNVALLTSTLERLTDESKELPALTIKYYGMYFLLVYCIDRMHERFIQDINETQLPKLQKFEQEAHSLIADAQNKIEQPGSEKESLMGNIETNKANIKACQHFADTLRDQRDTIINENKQIKSMLAAAQNTYKTVKLSNSIAQLMTTCQKHYKALQQLRLPPLRPFQNLQLKQELRQLTQRMLKP